jgi:hypothetical protein
MYWMIMGRNSDIPEKWLNHFSIVLEKDLEKCVGDTIHACTVYHRHIKFILAS